MRKKSSTCIQTESSEKLTCQLWQESCFICLCWRMTSKNILCDQINHTVQNYISFKNVFPFDSAFLNTPNTTMICVSSSDKSLCCFYSTWQNRAKQACLIFVITSFLYFLHWSFTLKYICIYYYIFWLFLLSLFFFCQLLPLNVLNLMHSFLWRQRTWCSTGSTMCNAGWSQHDP